MTEFHVDLGLLSDDQIILAPVPCMPWSQFAGSTSDFSCLQHDEVGILNTQMMRVMGQLS